tara:strand:- start:148 stop:609 length:462 start_codon:yes stop_codon:yes gene_type:complete
MILFLPTVMVAQKFQTKVFPGFNKDATMVVQSKPSQTNITGLIEAYLLMEGFNVRSEAISSSTKKEITNDVDESTVIDQDISVSKKTYIDSEYVIEINFSQQWDLIWKVKTFSMKISDLKTGKILALVNKKSKGMRNPDSVAEKAIEALMKSL